MPIYPYKIYFTIQNKWPGHTKHIIAQRVVIADCEDAKYLFLDSINNHSIRQGVRLAARTAEDAACQALIKLNSIVQDHFPELRYAEIRLDEIIPEEK